MRVLRAIVLPSQRVPLRRVVAIAIAILVSGTILCPAGANDLNQRRSGWYTGWGFGPFEMRLIRLVGPIWGNPADVLRSPPGFKGGSDSGDSAPAAVKGVAS